MNMNVNMSAFLTKLLPEPAHENLDDGWWVLTRPFCYRSDLLGESVIVPTGFQTDYATVPRLPFIFEMFGSKCTEPAVIHDYLYTTQDFPRKTADAVFFEASGVCNVKTWRKWSMWIALRIFGGMHWKTSPGGQTLFWSGKTRRDRM